MPGDIEIGWRRQLAAETRPWAIDYTLELDPSDVVGATTATLTDLYTGLDYSATGLLGTVGVVGNVATQSVTALVPGHNYRLVLTANMGGTKFSSTVLLLTCPY